MPRYVIVQSIHGDRANLRRVIGEAGFSLLPPQRPDDGEGLLSHPDFEGFSTPQEVSQAGKRLKESIDRASRYRGTPACSFEVGNVLRVAEDGRREIHVLLDASDNLAVAMTGSVAVTADLHYIRGEPLSDEERERRQRAEVERRDAETGRLVAAAMKDKRVLYVIDFLNRQPTLIPTDLGVMLEIVEDAVQGQLARYASEKQLKRFDRSINHPHVFGPLARHGKSDAEPPPNPMSLEEARVFACDVARRWLQELVATRAAAAP